MRLIDADKLMMALAEWALQEAPIHTYEKPKEYTADDMQRMIWRTIRDCESAVIEQSTVYAVPERYILGKIEWFKEAYEEYDGHWYKNCADALNELLDDWDTEGAFYEER